MNKCTLITHFFFSDLRCSFPIVGHHCKYIKNHKCLVLFCCSSLHWVNVSNGQYNYERLESINLLSLLHLAIKEVQYCLRHSWPLTLHHSLFYYWNSIYESIISLSQLHLRNDRDEWYKVLKMTWLTTYFISN